MKIQTKCWINLELTFINYPVDLRLSAAKIKKKNTAYNIEDNMSIF